MENIKNIKKLNIWKINITYFNKLNIYYDIIQLRHGRSQARMTKEEGWVWD